MKGYAGRIPLTDYGDPLLNETTSYRARWRIVGSGSKRARLAYAWLDGDQVVYEIA
jgi:hypothetical protein